MQSARYLRLTPVLTGLLLGLAAVASAADDTAAIDALAARLLEKSGIRVGVCELPRAGDGALAAAFARAGVAQVHGLAPDAHAVALARKPSADSSVLGSQVTLETGTPKLLPLGDWVADLVVIADATDENLSDLSAPEIRRVLSPYRGTAVIGQPAGFPHPLSKTALTDFAKSIDASAQVAQDDSGLWAVVHLPALPGGDDWSHFLHAADGNLVSHDQAFSSTPMELQWNSGYYGGVWDVHVIAGGRMFTAQCTGVLPYELVARNSYNGQVLWRKPIAKDFGLNSSLLVATPDRVYVKDAGAVQVLNAETGTELRRIVATDDPKEHCLWLLLSDGVLLTLTGPVQEHDERIVDDLGANKSRALRIFAQQDKLNELHVGHELTAWDANTGAQLWRFDEEKIDQSKLVVNEGRVFLYAKRQYATCLELKTGKQVWKTAAPISEPKGAGLGFIFNPDGTVVKGMLLGRQGAIATHDAYMINYQPHRQCQAFAADDGHLLWNRLQGPKDVPETPDVTEPIARKFSEEAERQMFGYQVVMGSTIIDQYYGRQFDLLTGKELQGRVHFENAGCSRFTATSNGLLFGLSGEIYNSKNSEMLLKYNAKSTCGAGQFVADGLLFKLATSCVGCTEWRGFYASRSVGVHEPRPGVRIEAGRGAEPLESLTDAADWTTYRSDNTRKGSSAAMIPMTAAIRWTYTPHFREFAPGPGGGYLNPFSCPTQAIAVGGRVWFGTAEGAVVCLDHSTGAELWRHWTCGKIGSAPTWWQGRVYVGSSDGWVYCLDAGTGAQVWRYRAAPEERRIMLGGRLSSAWPILANVLVQDGAVYAACGLIGQFGGSSLCALDARTGALRWEKRCDISASGQLAWYSGKLWMHAGDTGVYVIDPATGDMHSAVNGGVYWGRSRGQDIGILPGGWVAFGGLQIYQPPHLKQQARNTCAFMRAEPDGPPHAADGKPKPAVLTLVQVHDYDALPCWDTSAVLFFGRPAGYKTAPFAPLFCKNFGPKFAAETDAQANPKRVEWESKWLPDDEQKHPALPENFLSNNFRFASPVLAGNAILYVNDTTVVAVSRPDCRKLWKIKLPGTPLSNGMSLTRTGEVLVPLDDGRIVCIALADPAPQETPSGKPGKDGEKKSGSLQFPGIVHRLAAELPKLDGDAAKWAAVTALPAPFSKREAGHVKLAWRDEGLYGFIHAQTAKLQIDEATPWSKDCVEVWLETDCARESEMGDQAYQLVFAAKPASGPGNCLVMAAQGPLHAQAINAVWKPEDGGYAIEFFIPASELKAKLKPGTKFGFNYSINENGKPVEQFYADKSVDDNYAKPSAWGVIQFEE